MLPKVIAAFVAMAPLVGIFGVLFGIVFNAQKSKDETLRENNEVNVEIQAFLAKDRATRLRARIETPKERRLHRHPR